jgi:DNA replication protein DnaC
VEFERLARILLLIVDEVGLHPFDPEAAALFFALVSSRHERSSMIVSSNKTFSAWAEIFGDPVAVAALVDRLVHHPEGGGPTWRQLPASRARGRMGWPQRVLRCSVFDRG